jgi:hypothetical protein
MSDNLTKTIVLLLVILLGIILVAYIGIPVFKLIFISLTKALWAIAGIIAAVVKVIVFVLLYAGVAFGLITLTSWITVLFSRSAQQ